MSGAKTKAYKPYPSYKTSRASWLEKLPTHWGTERLKQHVDDVNEQTRERLPNDVYIALENVEGWTGKVTGAENEVSFDSQVKRFQVGDVLFGKLRPYLAKVNTPNKAGICVGEFLVLRCHRERLSPEFLGLLLRSKQVIDAVDASTFGAKMPRANWDFIGNMLCPVPPLDEQTAIVRCLDDADQRIRAYVSAKERLIALLEEERQVLIHQAVTRGLDPNAKLKHSGVEWLGDVPEHWDVSRVKNEFYSLNHRRIPLSANERGTMSVRQYDYYGASGVIDKVEGYLFNDELLLIAEDGANLVLRSLPLAIIARGKFWVNNHAHILKPRGGNLEFLAGLLEGINYTPWISGAAQPKLTQDRLMSIAITVPPKEQQDQIMERTSTETASIRTSISLTRRQIELMEEYRTRLIADVITGKIDVRGAKP